MLNRDIHNGIFISHLTEEKVVAHVLKKYLRLAFGQDFRVFVSSDAKSIGGGTKWYSGIISNLRDSEVVLVLVSHESKGKEWPNFEAGFGEGSGSLVIPVGINNLPLGRLSYPLAGIQGRSIDDIGPLLDDISNKIGSTPATIDATAYLREIRNAEATLIYRSLRVEPVVEGNSLHFDIQNAGNVDLELLMLEVTVPQDVVKEASFVAGRDDAGTSRHGIPYNWYGCCSRLGVYGHLVPILRPVITASMVKIRTSFVIGVRRVLSAPQKESAIFFQIHALGYRTDEEERKIAEVTGWS